MENKNLEKLTLMQLLEMLKEHLAFSYCDCNMCKPTLLLYSEIEQRVIELELIKQNTNNFVVSQ